jgi:hypothetical protein
MKLNLTPDLIASLDEVKLRILAEPHAFVMGAFLTKAGTEWWDEIKEPEKNTCGTACCIAGTWLSVLTGKDLLDLPNVARGLREDTDNYNLGVDQGIRVCLAPFWADQENFCFSSPWLFQTYGWPGTLRRRYNQCETDAERVEVAAEVIDLFQQSPGDEAEAPVELELGYEDDDEDDDDDDDEDGEE